MITELFYSHILNMNRVLFIQGVSGEYTSRFLDPDKLKWLCGPERFPGPSRTALQAPKTLPYPKQAIFHAETLSLS